MIPQEIYSPATKSQIPKEKRSKEHKFTKLIVTLWQNIFIQN